MIKVLVVDDSAFMRNILSSILRKSPEIEVVGTARNGEQALEMIRQNDPDVVTLDIEMPRMDGLTALRHIMMEMPRPVIMISSLTTEGAESTLKALELGAADFIPKQNFPDEAYGAMIRETVLTVAKSAHMLRRFSRPRPALLKASAPPVLPPKAFVSGPAAPPPSSGGRAIRDIVAIGVSTGGPPAVQKILAALPENFPAGVLIAQHMPAAFTKPFAKRLDNLSKLTVKEAESGDKLRNGMVFVAPGGKHIRIKPNLEIIVSEEPVAALYKPSVNELMDSVGKAFGRKALGVMLTGMGSDGLEGSKVLKAQGGRMLAQSEQTCVVYGMPKAVVDANLADEIVDIDNMAQAIINNLYYNK